MPRDNFHLTLSFLGHVADERVAEIGDVLGGAVRGLVDFATYLDGFGAFPSERRARVLWAGIADPAGGLAGVADAVGDALEPLGFPRELRPFRAHVTLARLRTPAPVRFPADLALPPTPVPVERVTLFQSRLKRPAPAYHALAEYPFRRA